MGPKTIALGLTALCGLCSIGKAQVLLPATNYPLANASAVAIGDVNNDARNDVVVTAGGTVYVFLQDALGGLALSTNYPAGNGQSVGIADLNHDGRKDVVVSTDSGVGVLFQNNAGWLDPVVNFPGSVGCYKLRVGDFNGDGLPDVVSIAWGTSSADVFLQSPTSTLGTAVVYSVVHGGYDDLEVGDLNGDGRQDIAVLSGQSTYQVGVLLQTTNGTFAPPVYYASGIFTDHIFVGLGIGDVNGDGRQDAVVSQIYPGASLRILLQNAGGSLNAPLTQGAAADPEAVEIDDVNGDGRPDVVVVHGGTGQAGVFLQQPDGSLGGETTYGVPYVSHYNPHGLAIGDINGDDAKDVVIANSLVGLVVLRQAPIVTISAPDPDASESGDTGMFTITRAGGLKVPLTVALNVSGSATYGFDYAAFPLLITFLPNVASTNIVVQPLDDSIRECDESVDLSVAATSAYYVGDPGSATVVITEDSDDVPAISVTAADASASEYGPDTGTFRILVNACTPVPLTVNYSVGGTATPGIDYTNIGNSVIIPAGNSFFDVKVTPIPDNQAEGDETVSMTLLPGPGYAFAAPTNAIVVIHDKPYDAWRLTKFTSDELTNDAISGIYGDPDNDAIINLQEYAFYLDPKVSSLSGLPTMTLENGFLTLTYTRASAATDITYAVQVAGDIPGPWNSGSSYTLQLSVVSNAVTQTFKVRDRTSARTANRRFMRLKLSYTP